jgi:hypothetical protein
MNLTNHRMEDKTLWLTDHAEKRMAQWNLSIKHVTYVIKHGKPFHRAGACLIYLRGCDIPKENRADNDLRRLEGVVVVLDRTKQWVLTVYRNRQYGLKHIKRKPTYGHPSPHNCALIKETCDV